MANFGEMADPVPRDEHYDVYDVAFLAGGAPRAIDAALVALVQCGRVGLTSTHELFTVDPRRRHPVEAAVLDAIGARPRHSARTVRRQAEVDPRVAAVGEQLIADGLLARRRRRRPGRSTVLVLTVAGRRAVRRLRSDLPAREADAMRVALGGLRALDDPELRAAVAPPPHRRAREPHWDAREDAQWSLTGGPGVWGRNGPSIGI